MSQKDIADLSVLTLFNIKFFNQTYYLFTTHR